MEIKKLDNNLIQSTLDSLSAHIAILDSKGIIRYVNQAWRDFARSNGLTAQSCCEGTNYLKVVQNSDTKKSQKTARGIAEVIEEKRNIFQLEYPCHSPEEKRWFNMRVTPFKGEQKDYAVIVAHENITERELQRLKLEEEKEFNNNILCHLTEMIIYMDADFNIQWANKSALELNNLKFEDIEGKKCYQKWDFTNFCTDCPLKKAQKTKEVEEAVMEKENDKIWRIKAIPDLDPEGNIRGFIEVALDITKEKTAERKIKQVVNKLEDQFEKAGRLHDQFLPSRTPKFENLTIATYYSPAERLGGDFYNFIKLENHLIFYISDVSGHDLSGSMLNIFLKETINTYLISKNISKNEKALNPAKILKYINQRYNEETFPADYFICLLLGIMDLNSREIRFSNAGIQFSPLLLNADGAINSFNCGGMPISFVSFGEYDVCNFTLKAGDIFFINTDGLLEQNNSKELYGQQRLMELLAESRNQSPDQIIEKIYQDFKNFRGDIPVQDDITYLLLKHN